MKLRRRMVDVRNKPRSLYGNISGDRHLFLDDATAEDVVAQVVDY
jgi:hypothetical protein